ncbi:MAG TPA: restriction endonuclease subunit S [Gammaproteobacteria bacterium]|nr:restriction endonuclease subunit S [Gammaproteobacteria bacterium]
MPSTKNYAITSSPRSNIPLRPLGEVCKINPRLAKEEKPSADALVTFVPMSAVDEESGTIQNPHIRPYSEVSKGYTYFKTNDVLFAKITPCMENGKVAIASELVNGIGFGSTEFHVLRSGPEVLPEWIFYFVRREEFRRRAKANFTGSAGQQRVPKHFLETVQIPVPPLSEQRRIVDILKRADSIRRLRKQAIDTAHQLIPALFIDMFGDPATNPKGWVVKSLREVADIGSGVTKGRKLGGQHTVELPYLAVSNVQDGYLDLTKIKTIRVKPDEIEKYRVLPGDFLMTEGGDPDKLGRGAIWNGELDVCLHQNHVFRVRCDPDRLLPEYLRSLNT